MVLYSLEPPSGMQREVGLLFAQLEDVRRRTRSVVAGMSTAVLDRRIDGAPHSIAAHLFHVAGMEYRWLHEVVLGEAIPESMGRELAAARLDADASRQLGGHDVVYYLGKLDEVRAQTESICWRLKDDDLAALRTHPLEGEPCTVRWILANLCDHEAHHRGEIQLMKRLVGSAGARP